MVTNRRQTKTEESEQKCADHMEHDGVVSAGYLYGDGRFVVSDGADIFPTRMGNERVNLIRFSWTLHI